MCVDMKKVGVIGIGNPLRGDDGIGIVLLEKLVERKDDLPGDIEYIDGGTGGMNLLHLLARFDIVFFIDAVNFGGYIGESKLFKAEDVYSKKPPMNISTHDSDFLKIIHLSKELGENPDELYIFGIQPMDTSHGQDLTWELEKAVKPLIVSLLIEIMTILNKSRDDR
jgi:hydrogenase maturation protease